MFSWSTSEYDSFKAGQVHSPGLCAGAGCIHSSACHVQICSPPQPLTLQVLKEEPININQESEAHA